MNGDQIINTIASMQSFTMLGVCLLCFIYFNRLSSSLKLLSYYLFFMLVINTLASEMASFGLNNLATTHLLVLGEFIFLSLFYQSVLPHYFIFKKYFSRYLAIVGGFIIANTLYLEQVNEFNTNAKVIVLFFILFFTILFFYDRSKHLTKPNLQEKAIRLVNVALLLYYSGSFFYFLFYKFTQNHKQFYTQGILVFNAALYLLYTILIAIAIIQVISPRPKPTS